MNELKQEKVAEDVTAQIYNYSPEEWESVKPDIFNLLASAKSEKVTSMTEEDFEKIFTTDDSRWLRMLLKSGNRIIGFSIVHPDRKQEFYNEGGLLKSKFIDSLTRAEIEATFINAEFQGRGLVGKLMEAVEEELRARGFIEMYRRVRSDNGYADAVERHYGDRILSKYIVTPNLTQFVIKL